MIKLVWFENFGRIPAFNDSSWASPDIALAKAGSGYPLVYHASHKPNPMWHTAAIPYALRSL